MDDDNPPRSEPEDDMSSINGIKFKAMKKMEIREDIPLEFWKESEEDEEEPRIIEVKDKNEGVPVRGKCIVCYKEIYENDSDLFRCPNCGREAHYLCATIFITEHGICPVCSTKIERTENGKYAAITQSSEKR
ncbi:MAG: hypothetical protein ACTSU9_13155 [Promethearchaeota archaeon]